MAKFILDQLINFVDFQISLIHIIEPGLKCIGCKGVGTYCDICDNKKHKGFFNW